MSFSRGKRSHLNLKADGTDSFGQVEFIEILLEVDSR